VKRHKAHLRRVDHRSIANFGNTRALDPSETEELRQRRREGWRIEHLARAYGVSTRTIVRYLSATPPFRVHVENWQAWFVIGQGDRPVQVSAWEPAT